jgi:hypothetical protein
MTNSISYVALASVSARCVSLSGGEYCSLFLCSVCTFQGQEPDWLLHHGKVITVDANFSIAEAVAITGDRFTAVGTNDTILKLAASARELWTCKVAPLFPA